MNGYLKIKTKIDNKDVDKGITELENKINKLQENNKDASVEQKGLENEINNYEQLCQEAEAYRQKIKQLELDRKNMYASNPNLSVSTDTGLANLNSQIDSVKQKYAQATIEIDKQAPKIDKVYAKLSKVKSKQVENNAKITQFKQKIDSVNADKVKGQIDGIGKRLTSHISKLGRMGLAIFGIRTAYNAVRSAISTVSQYNTQVATNIEYIRYVLANALLPVIQKIISFAFTLLSYINAILNGWFGINLFGSSSVKQFQKMQKSASGTAKSAKEIQKSLQGFDEMNVLQDNTNSNSGSGVGTPSMDLSGIQGDVPAWLQWIIDNKDIVLSILAGITAGIIALKFGLSGIKSLGIGIIIAGIVALIQDVIKYIKDPSFDNFLNILKDIAIIALGVGIVLGSWPLIIGAVIALIVVEIVKHWDEIKDILRKSRTMDL